MDNLSAWLEKGMYMEKKKMKQPIVGGEKKRFEFIDVIEVLAIVFVVTYHSRIFSWNILYEANAEEYINYMLQAILSVGVPLFFFANGYLLFSKKFELKKHIYKMIRMTMLTIVWGIILLLVIMPIVDVYFTPQEFLVALRDWKAGWINQLWYMGALICIYVFFPLIKNAYDSNKKVFYYFVAICAMMTFGNKLLNEIHAFIMSITQGTRIIASQNMFNMFNPFRGIYGFAIVYFCLGGIALQLQHRLEKYNRRIVTIVAMVSIVVCSVLLTLWGIWCSKLTGILWDIVWDGYDTLFTLVNVIMIFALCYIYQKPSVKWISKGVRLISENTLGIYFLHVPIFLLTMERAMESNFLSSYLGNLLYGFFVVMVSLLLALILKRIPVIKQLLK